MSGSTFVGLRNRTVLKSICIHTDQVHMADIYILLTKHEGRTGRMSARGLDSTDQAQRGLCKKD